MAKIQIKGKEFQHISIVIESQEELDILYSLFANFESDAVLARKVGQPEGFVSNLIDRIHIGLKGFKS